MISSLAGLYSPLRFITRCLWKTIIWSGLKETSPIQSKEEDIIKSVALHNEPFWNIGFYSFSVDAFISELQLEYSKLNLWIKNSEIADSLMKEYDAYADKPEKLGTTIRVVRLQLHENQVCIIIDADLHLPTISVKCSWDDMENLFCFFCPKRCLRPPYTMSFA